MLNSRCQLYCNEDETLTDLAQRLKPITIDGSSQWILGNTYCYSTPIMRGYGVANLSPFACVIITPEDNLPSIKTAFQRVTEYAAGGSGISLYLGNIRSIGSYCHQSNLVQGIMPFVKLADANISAIKQTSLRDGAGIVWLNVDHPEIQEFLTIGDPISPIQKLKTGVVLTDEFMEAVKKDTDFILKNSDKYYEKYPNCNSKKIVKARALLNKIAAARLRKGNPSIFFRHDSNVQCPNLCCEVLLDTRKHEIEVCCLATVNISEFINEYRRLNNDSLYSLMTKLIEKLRGIRTSVDIPSGNAVGVGIAGVFDVINHICKYEKTRTKYFIDHFITDLISVLKRVKSDYPDGQVLAIAPNTYTSYVMGCSAGITPRPTHIYSKHLSRGKVAIKCPVWDSSTSKLFYMSNINRKPPCFEYSNEFNLNLMETIVAKLTPHIDQGISCSTIYEMEEDANATETLRRHAIHIEKLYYAGFKTIYYHSTRTSETCNLGGESCNLCEN